MRRVVVTGVGVVSSGGFTADDLWTTLIEGRSLVRRISRFDVSSYPTQIAAGIDDAGLPQRLPGESRIAQFAKLAARDAIADAHLDEDTRARAGAVIATGMGNYGHAEVFGACAAAGANRTVDWPLFHAAVRKGLEPRAAERRTPGSIPAEIAREHRFGGSVMSVMTACAGGTQAIGDAARWIRTGRADVVLAGGSDSELYPMGLASFCLLGALSKCNDDPARASRPFDDQRDGFVIGEGAAMLMLEERGHALARGAKIYAEVAGFGSASDAYRVTDPHPDGSGAILAMRGALRQANIEPERVGYINAHGTSTVANDRIETRAIREVFGAAAPRIPISSTKSIVGHLTVAAGALEALACILTLQHQKVHPTANLSTPDAECDLDYVPGVARTASVEFVLSNSFAFGGQCASLLLRHAGTP